MTATLRHVARYASFFCLPVEAVQNGAKESTSATVHHDGCAGVWHASGASNAEWCWDGAGSTYSHHQQQQQQVCRDGGWCVVE